MSEQSLTHSVFVTTGAEAQTPADEHRSGPHETLPRDFFPWHQTGTTHHHGPLGWANLVGRNHEMWPCQVLAVHEEDSYQTPNQRAALIYIARGSEAAETSVPRGYHFSWHNLKQVVFTVGTQ